jgi:hypothetical protein
LVSTTADATDAVPSKKAAARSEVHFELMFFMLLFSTFSDGRCAHLPLNSMQRRGRLPASDHETV